MKVATETRPRPPDGYVTVAQTCDRLGLSRWSVYRLIRKKNLKARKAGTVRNAPVFVAIETVEAYAATRVVPPVYDEDER